jgi:hypothetical protein
MKNISLINIFARSAAHYAHNHAALLGYFGVYLIVTAIILPPTCESFLSDDGDYALTVRDWLEHGRLRITDFPSMTLIAHLVWGLGFATVLGPGQSVLRVSTMIMAWVDALAAYDLVASYRKDRKLAAFVAATYVFSPLIFYYSYTLNTDVAGCSTMLMFLAMVNRLQLPRSIPVAGFMGASAAFGFLVRQNAAISAFAYGAWISLLCSFGKVSLRHTCVYWLTFLAPIFAYLLWLYFDYGWPLGYDRSMLHAEVIQRPKIAFVKALRMLMAIALYFSSVLILFISWRRSQRYAMLGVLIVASLITLGMFRYEKMLPIRPYWSIDLYDCGLGRSPDIDTLFDLRTGPGLILGGDFVPIFELVVVSVGTLAMVLSGYTCLLRRNSWYVLLVKTITWKRIDGRSLFVPTMVGHFFLGLMV